MLRQAVWGAGTGTAVSLAVLLFGFSGGEGWQYAAAARAMSIVTMLVLLFLGGLVGITEYGRYFGMRISEESRARRSSMLPFFLGLTAAVFAAYMWIGSFIPSMS